MSKIGFFGGCFNPPTCAHIDLAKEMLINLKLDKIVFVPVGDYYKKQGLVKAEHRYNMLEIAVCKIDNLEVEDIEIKISKKIYAKDIFEMLSNKYREDELYFIMGTDNFLKMHTWKEYEYIIEKYNYIIVKRANFEVDINKENIIYYIPKEIKDVSSTLIRNLLYSNEKIDEYLDKDVYKYIIENKLYNT